METNQIKQFITSLLEAFSQNATIKKVYGDPIETQGKTIIPVARIAMGFGGGFGKNKSASASETHSAEPKGEGGGLGGGLRANPIGVIEITGNQTRFIRFNSFKYIGLGIVFGLVISRLIQRARRKQPLSAV